MSDPVSGFKKVKKLMAELKEEEKKAKEKKEDKGSFIQQVILLMMAGPLIGTFILWVMTYMLTDAINHLARIHNWREDYWYINYWRVRTIEDV